MSVLTLIEAVKAGDCSAVQTLINNHAAIEQADDYGWTALNWAAGKGDTAMVQQLLNAGANVTHTGRDKRTAYQIALAAGQVNSAAILQQAEQKLGLNVASNPYCKAYSIEALRKFPAWSEPQTALDADDIVYLHADFSVTLGIGHDENIVFQSSSLAWQTFCMDVLAFAVPTDLALAAAFVAKKSTATVATL